MTLKELRIQKGLTQLEASRICEIPIRSYKRLEGNLLCSNNQRYKYAFNTLENYAVHSFNTNNSTKVLVIGAGYVGLSISVLLAQYCDVTVVDIDKDKVKKINEREPIFKDKEIEDYLKNKKLKLHAFEPNVSLYKGKDIIVIAIPTNYDNDTGMLDTSNIVNLIKEIRNVNNSGLIVIKSTCNIGFTDSLNDKNVIFSPEFLREGRALLDNLYPTRIVIGGDKSNRKVKAFAKLMQSCTLNRARVIFMTSKEAESVKLFSNAYLAMRVAYFNELDSFALTQNIDSKMIVEGVSLDPRIGSFYNNPSFGYGGYCLPKDTDSLITQIKFNGIDSLIASISKSNKERKVLIAKDILKRLEEKNGSVIGVYSVQSKKDSDNKRHAAILDIISLLEQTKVTIVYYKPNKMSLESFKKQSDIIIANRYESSLDDVIDKVYSRDIFGRD